MAGTVLVGISINNNVAGRRTMAITYTVAWFILPTSSDATARKVAKLIDGVAQSMLPQYVAWRRSASKYKRSLRRCMTMCFPCTLR